MAETKVVTLELKSNLNEAEKSVISLKSQLREAQNEVNQLSEKFGATSDQAVEAAKGASELKDKIADAKSLTDAFNPDAKFKSLTASLSGAAGGLSAITGAYALLGSESKEVEGLILKVQSAMAISSGLQTVGESIDSFKQLRAVVQSYTIVQKITTAAQYVWNAATSANPLGALVLVITAVIAAGYKLVTFFIESAAANDAAMAATKRNTIALKEHEKSSKNSTEALKENNDKQYALAKASGTSSEALRKLALKHADETVALNNKNTTLARTTFLREADTLAALKANDASDEVIAAQQKLLKSTYESFDKQREGLYASYKDRRKVITNNEVEIAQEGTDKRKKDADDLEKHNKELLDKQKEAAKKAAEERKRAIEEAEKLEKDRRKSEQDLEKKYLDDLLNLDAKSEGEKLDLQAQRDIAEINKIAKTANEKANLLALYNEKYILLNQELDDKNKAEQLAKDSKNKLDIFNNDKLSFETRLQAITDREALEKDIIFKSQEERTAFEKENSDARIKIAELETLSKIEQAQRMGALLSSVSELIGKDTAAGKVAAVAATTINTYAAAQAAFLNAQKNPISIIGPAYPYISAGLAIAGGLKNVQSILAVKTPGGGGGGGSVGGGASSMGSAPNAPTFNVVGNSGVNQVANVLQNQGAAPVQAYVVANNVTTQQGLNRNIVSNATLG